MEVYKKPYLILWNQLHRRDLCPGAAKFRIGPGDPASGPAGGGGGLPGGQPVPFCPACRHHGHLSGDFWAGSPPSAPLQSQKNRAGVCPTRPPRPVRGGRRGPQRAHALLLRAAGRITALHPTAAPMTEPSNRKKAAGIPAAFFIQGDGLSSSGCAAGRGCVLPGG